MLLILKKQDQISDAELDYIGILPGDLDSPTANNPEQVAMYGFSPRPDFIAVSCRIGSALDKWRDMTEAKRSFIPYVMEFRADLRHSVERLGAEIEKLKSFWDSN
jgi:hypothetical protein